MEHNHDHETHHAAAPATGTPTWLLPASILAAAVLISGSLIYMVQSNKTAPSAPEDADNNGVVTVTAPAAEERDAILGDPNAPVTVIAYEDFQCPFCAQYYDETESQIRTTYVQPGKVKLVYRHLAFLGPESVEAAEASECAKDQGKFWEYHDSLFDAEMIDGQEHNGNLNRALFVKIARDLKLDEAAFASCYDENKHAAFVKQQTEEAPTKYGVESTPTIFVNDQKILGAYPFSTFQEIIDGILNR